jgi:integrase
LTLCEFWHQDYQYNLKARIKASSWKKEVGHFENRINPILGKKPLKAITHEDVERMVDQMRAEELTPRTQQYAIGTLFRIWKLAAKRKLVKTGDNPAAGIQLEKVNNTRLRVLSPKELKEILDYLAISDPPAKDITSFCVYTGCRFSEAAKLTWEHVNFMRKTILFADTKNGDSRELYLEPCVISLLERRIPGRTGELVFTKRDRLPFNEPPSAFKTAVDRLSLNKDRGTRDRITFHSLRHTAATFAARNNTPVKDMQLIFGWKTPSMVFRYVKGDKETQRLAMKGLAHSLSEDSEKIISIEEIA